MKIAYIVPSLRRKGPLFVVENIIRNLINLIYIDVYYFDDSNNSSFSCSTYKISFNKPIDFDKYNIIHTHGFRPDKYVYKWRKLIKRAKTVTTIHQDIFPNLLANYGLIVALVFTPYWIYIISKIDKQITISNTLKLRYINFLPDIKVIHNGINIFLKKDVIIDTINNKIRYLKEKNKRIISTYASINKGKGIDQLVKVLKLRNDIGLVIIGEGKEKKKLENLAKKLHVYERCLFFNYLFKPYNYLQYCDIYMMPSRNEGFGLAVIEAIIMNKPVICSDIEIFNELFTNTEVTFFKLDDIYSLSLAIDQAWLSQETKTKKALSKVTNFYTDKIMSDKYLQAYENIL